MAMEQNPGFLAALGMNVDKEAILRSQKRQQQADALGLVESMGFKTPHEQMAANVGALLGARLAKPEGLTDDQQRKVTAAEATNRRMEEWLKQNDKAPLHERELKYMEFTAEEAFRNGLSDIGAQAAGMVDERRRLRQLQDIELEAAGYKPAQAKANLAQTESSTNVNKGVGRYRSVWQYGETNPNKSRYAWIDPATGDALSGPGGEVIAKAGQYTDQSPTAPNPFGRGGSGAGFGATPTEMGKVRDAYSALYRRGNTLDEMRTVLEESIATTGTLAATGNAGKITAWTSRMANDVYNMMAAAGMAGDFTAVDRKGQEYSLDTAQGRQKLASQYRGVITKFLPPEFVKTAQQADKWASLVTELMYLEARSAEAGAKQFSDKDIEAMAQIVGANLNDPQALSDVILSSYNRAASDLEYSLLRYPPQVRDLIVSPEAQAELATQKAEVLGRWEQPLVAGDAFHKGPKKGPKEETDDEILQRFGIKAPPQVTPPTQQTNPYSTGSRGPQRRRTR